MGISTAKTLLSASTFDVEAIFTENPLKPLWTKLWKAHNTAAVARAAAVEAAAKVVANVADT